MRTVPIQLLRLALLLLLLFFMHFLGRVGARLHRQKQPYAKAITWFLRTAVALFAILWTGGLDALAIAAISLGAAAFGAGIWVESRPRKVEEIHLFPGDDRPE